MTWVFTTSNSIGNIFRYFNYELGTIVAKKILSNHYSAAFSDKGCSSPQLSLVPNVGPSWKGCPFFLSPKNAKPLLDMSSMLAKIKSTEMCCGSALLSAVGNKIINRNYPYGV